MLKRVVCLLIVGSIISITTVRCLAAADSTTKEAAFIARVKSTIANLGTGPSAKAEITLRDKSKLKGYIKEANEEYFVMVSDKSLGTTEVAYTQVQKVKGNNLSTGAKVAIGVGIGIGILILVFKDHIVAY
jgi:hypothetical protein